MKQILVTGASGQLGQSVKQHAQKYPNLNFIYTDVDDLDITDTEAVKAFFETHGIDAIINCAAYTNVDKAETDYKSALKINAKAVGFLAKSAQKYNALFIHISTDYVFDSGGQLTPYKESDKVNPISAYGKTKLAGESEAQKCNRHIIIRTSWLYSPYGNNFAKTMLRLGKEKDQLNVVFDQIGTPTYAPDLADAVLQIINKDEKNAQYYGIYHYSNEGVCSWYDFASEIMAYANLTCKVYSIESKEFPTPAKRPHFSVLNKSKIKGTFKIKIPYWRKSMEICLDILTVNN